MMLTDVIKEQIEKEGPISFHDFMEHALYYPGLGYYTSPKEQIGQNGDYFTSSSLTPAFGAMIAKQVREMWDLSGEKNFTIVEYGAGTGLLCHDILKYFKEHTNLSDFLTYCIIEKSPVMRERQQKHLTGKVKWNNSLAEIEPVTGCILSNELLDNFSVHQVIMEDELMEIFLDYKNGFTEVLKPANKLLREYFVELGVQIPRGFRTEINIEAIEWIREIAAGLEKGYVLTIDYGATSQELYAPAKSNGTILCYNKHTINEHPYKDIGEQDITSHVNFSALRHYGSQNGLEYCGYTDQAHFLLALGFKEWLRKTLPVDQDIIKMVKKESFLTHMMLVDMGSKFKVLIQRKGIPDHPLSGFHLS